MTNGNDLYYDATNLAIFLSNHYSLILCMFNLILRNVWGKKNGKIWLYLTLKASKTIKMTIDLRSIFMACYHTNHYSLLSNGFYHFITSVVTQLRCGLIFPFCALCGMSHCRVNLVFIVRGRSRVRLKVHDIRDFGSEFEHVFPTTTLCSTLKQTRGRTNSRKTTQKHQSLVTHLQNN
jgi:hypothetical protein